MYFVVLFSLKCAELLDFSNITIVQPGEISMEFEIEMFSPPKKQGIYFFFLHKGHHVPIMHSAALPHHLGHSGSTGISRRPLSPGVWNWETQRSVTIIIKHTDLLSLLSLMYLFPLCKKYTIVLFFVNIDSPLTCSFTCFNRATHYSSCEALMASEI
ncbi:hypothetical protein F7725_005445 [Dissostichus mawsoni]|uniref:Uncharacterized protein n=1 Tax=Dissostichus mawsoni TaxID=36200 RepID=A0A7J5YRQ9_DISMA|nr:hypothetical protein F7725_005445 [Dissostichus mawsoni]